MEEVSIHTKNKEQKEEKKEKKRVQTFPKDAWSPAYGHVTIIPMLVQERTPKSKRLIDDLGKMA
ncbi:hypothetical protein J6590_103658, partial [Homalodisca vitripennis]